MNTYRLNKRRHVSCQDACERVHTSLAASAMLHIPLHSVPTPQGWPPRKTQHPASRWVCAEAEAEAETPSAADSMWNALANLEKYFAFLTKFNFYLQGNCYYCSWASTQKKLKRCPQNMCPRSLITILFIKTAPQRQLDVQQQEMVPTEHCISTVKRGTRRNESPPPITAEWKVDVSPLMKAARHRMDPFLWPSKTGQADPR